MRYNEIHYLNDEHNVNNNDDSDLFVICFMKRIMKKVICAIKNYENQIMLMFLQAYYWFFHDFCNIEAKSDYGMMVPEEFFQSVMNPTIPFPGPKAQAIISRCQDVGVDAFGSVIAAFDLKKSYGPYTVDADGVPRLDFFGHIASNALGYNNPLMIGEHLSSAAMNAATGRIASGVIITEDYINDVEQIKKINHEYTKCIQKTYEKTEKLTKQCSCTHIVTF